jgi:hypothetical protein
MCSVGVCLEGLALVSEGGTVGYAKRRLAYVRECQCSVSDRQRWGMYTVNVLERYLEHVLIVRLRECTVSTMLACVGASPQR